MNQGPTIRLHYCFLIILPFSLRPLPSLISSFLNLPFGTQGRSWRQNEIYFLQIRNWGPRRLFAQKPQKALLGYNVSFWQVLLSFLILIEEAEALDVGNAATPYTAL